MNQTETHQATNGAARTTEHLATAAHHTVDRLADSARTAEHELRARASALGERVRQGEQRAQQAVEVGVRNTKAYIKHKPLIATGLALAAGLALGGLFLRR